MAKFNEIAGKYEGICNHCGETIFYEYEDVGYGRNCPHGFCKNKNCQTYGWATDSINELEGDDEED